MDRTKIALFVSVLLLAVSMAGTASASNPPPITTCAQLQNMSLYLDAPYELANDIDCSELACDSFSPIGNALDQFSGVLNGNGYAITGLSICADDDYAGLFGYIYSAHIFNLTLDDVNITNTNGHFYTGALAGVATNSIIEDVSVSGTVDGWARVGGLVGFVTDDFIGVAGEEDEILVNAVDAESDKLEDIKLARADPLGDTPPAIDPNEYGLIGDPSGEGSETDDEPSEQLINESADEQASEAGSADAEEGIGITYVSEGSSLIKNCSSSADVNGTGLRVGGLIGYAVNVVITGSASSGNVDGFGMVGGLVGQQSGYSSIIGSSSSGNVVGIGFVGGLIGYSAYSSIASSYAVGNVNGDYNVGGLVGDSVYTQIDGSYATGDVDTDFDGNSVGGLIGYNEDSQIANSYADGNVNGDNYVGGLVGYNTNDESSSPITNSHASGEVTGDFYVGGLIGYNDYSPIINCYAAGDASGFSNRIGGLIGFNDGSPVTGSYAGGEVSGNWSVGGLIGWNSESQIEDSYATGGVSGDLGRIGGLIGYNYESPVSDASAEGSVSGTRMAGGLIGVNDESPVVDSSYLGDSVTGVIGRIGGLIGQNTESPITNANSSAEVSGLWGIGGLIGMNQGSPITSAHTGGTVSGTLMVGGLVGFNSRSPITQSVSEASAVGEESAVIINALGEESAIAIEDYDFSYSRSIGGLVGGNGGSAITSSYATGGASGDEFVGGLVGRNIFSPIADSYATGEVGGNAGLGGLVGMNFLGSPITNSYAIGNVDGGHDGGIIGGLIGMNIASPITASYSTGVVTPEYSEASEADLSSIVASEYFPISESDLDIMVPSLPSSNMVGGLIGANTQSLIADCGWWTGASDNAIGYDASEDSVESLAHEGWGWDNEDATVFYDDDTAIYDSWDFDSVWSNCDNDGYPLLRWTNIDVCSGSTGLFVAETKDVESGDVGVLSSCPFPMFGSGSAGTPCEIINCSELQDMNANRDAFYELVDDIDCSGTDVLNDACFGVPDEDCSQWEDDLGCSDDEYHNGQCLWNDVYFESCSLTPTDANCSQWTGNATCSAYSSHYGQCSWNATTSICANVTGSGLTCGAQDDASACGNVLGCEVVTSERCEDDSPGLSCNQVTETACENVGCEWGYQGFVPIGDSENPFTGVLDGNGYKILSLFIYLPNEDNVGLFGYTEGAYIHDVGISDADITGDYAVGGLAGDAELSSITRCYLTDDEANNYINGNDGVGGLVGNNDGSSITESSSYADVDGDACTGGLVGDNYYSVIISSSTSGEVDKVDDGQNLGGLVGHNQYSSVTSSYSGDSIDGDSRIGGLVGYNYLSSIVGAESDSSGAHIYGEGWGIGGLAGVSEYSSIIDSSFAGDEVDSNGGGNKVGGLVGKLEYSSISESNSNVQVNGDENIGGLVGKSEYSLIVDSETNGVEDAAAYGEDIPEEDIDAACHPDVSGDYNVGGLVGKSENSLIADAYADGYVRGYDWNIGGLVGKSEDSLIAGSYADGRVKGYDWNIGGLVGKSEDSLIAGSEADGYVKGYDWDVGGLVGDNDYSPIIDSTAYGNVRSDNWDVGGLVGDNYYSPIVGSSAYGEVNGDNWDVGGLVGDNDYSPIIDSSSSNDGDVNGEDGDVGGLVGDNHGSLVASSYSTSDAYGDGNVGGLIGYNEYSMVVNTYAASYTSSGDDDIGGLVGDNYFSLIANSYSTGNASGSDDDIGGLVGDNVFSLIANSYSTCNASSSDGDDDDYVGGLVGKNDEYSIIDNSYWLGDSLSQGSVGITEVYEAGSCIGNDIGGVATDCTEKDNETYFFDNTNAPMDVWDFCQTPIWGINGTYPMLAGEATFLEATSCPQEETHHHHDSCSKAWECTSWSSCSNGEQTRECDCACSNSVDCTGSNDEEQSCTAQPAQPSPAACTASWSCTAWGNCANSLQSRTCTCSCTGGNCLGDSSGSKACVMPIVPGAPEMDVEGGEQPGDNATADVTDGGLPAEGIVLVTGPDGTVKQFVLSGGKIDFTPDKPGVWTLTYTDSDGNIVTKTITVAAAPALPKPPASVVTPTPAPSVTQGGEFPWLIVLGAIVIAAIIAALLLTKKKSKKRK